MKAIFKVFKKIKRFFFTLIVKCSGYKNSDLQANGFTGLGNRVKLGTNCHFNGMRILGNGEVMIRDNFHSGCQYQMISYHHNYDGIRREAMQSI